MQTETAERWIQPNPPDPPEDPVLVVEGESAPLSAHLDVALAMHDQGEERAALRGVAVLRALRDAIEARR